MDNLDSKIHQPVRLRIMSSLCSVRDGNQFEFTHLRDLLSVTDGNLGAHLQKLEEADYIKVEKTFVGRKPRTFISVTSRGRAAFEDHVAALKQILSAAE